MFLSVEDIDRQCPRGVEPNNTELWLTFPFDDNCLRSFFHKLTAHLRRYFPWEEWMYTTLYVLISVLALVGNGVVILAVIRKREMRTARNVLIVNLALSNLMLALTTVPFLWLPSIDFDFPYSNFFCKFANALPGSNIYCSTLTISVMAIDRYYSVRSIKIKSSAKSGGQCLRAILISVFIWMFSLLLSFPLLIYYRVNMLYVFKDVYVIEDSPSADEDLEAIAGNNNFSLGGVRQQRVVLRSYGWRQCRLMTTAEEGEGRQAGQAEEQWAWMVDERMVQLGMSLMQAIMLYVVPLVVISIFNLKLTRFLKMNAKQVSGSTKGGKKATIANGNSKFDRKESDLLKESENSDDLEQQQLRGRRSTVGTTSLSGCKSALCKRATADRRQNRTTALLVAMAGSYAVLWLPFTFISVLIDLDLLGVESGSPVMERIDQTCKLVSILSICVNPFLYGFLNTNFRNEFNEIFTKCLRYVPSQKQQNLHLPLNKCSTKRGEAYSAVVSTQLDGVSVSTTAYRRSAES